MTVLVVPEGALMQGVATDTEASKRHHTVADFRRHFAGIVTQPGLANVGDCLVTATGTPNGHVHVSTGAVWVKGSQAAQQGTYMLYNDGDQDIDVLGPNPAHATLPRVDAIVAQLTDAFYSGSDGEFIQPVTGTPNASPALPTLPANSYALAYVLIPAASATITTVNIANVAAQARRGNGPSVLYEFGPLAAISASFVFPPQLPSPAPAMTLPTTGRHLRLDVIGRTDNAVTFQEIALRFNNDSGSTYGQVRLTCVGNVATVQDAGAVAQTFVRNWFMPGASGTAGWPGITSIRIPHYSGTTFRKVGKMQTDFWNGTGAFPLAPSMTNDLIDLYWNNTAAMTRVDAFPVVGNWAIGSHAVLFVED